jgi:AcrR family transcriptional regulator
MSVNQDDLRVIKTKRALREAFIHLLLEKDYDAISIKEIAAKAESARVTFYRHYKNKEELLVDCLRVTFEELKARIKPASRLSLEDVQKGYLPMQILFEHIAAEEMLYRILFSNRGPQVVIGLLRKFLADRVKIQLMDQFPADQLQAPLDIIAYHFASAQIGLAGWWLENDMPYSPEYMAQISFWLSIAGSARGYGVENVPLVPPTMPGIK